MDCSCDIEPADFWKFKEPKARKEHVCCECGGQIKPGERYHVTTWGFEGALHSAKHCADCEHWKNEISRTLYAQCGEWCYYFGDMVGTFQEGVRGLVESNAGAQIIRLMEMHNAIAVARQGSERFKDIDDDREFYADFERRQAFRGLGFQPWIVDWNIAQHWQKLRNGGPF